MSDDFTRPDDRDSWRTPPMLVSWLNSRFHFTLDAAASDENAVCDRYLDEIDNTLGLDIKKERVFCNPPYTKDKEFAEHLYYQYVTFNTPCLLLLPVRSDRVWWNALRTAPGVRVEFYTGRIHFSGAGKGAFMYNVNFIFGYDEVPKCDPIDASRFNTNGKGGATK